MLTKYEYEGYLKVITDLLTDTRRDTGTARRCRIK